MQSGCSVRCALRCIQRFLEGWICIVQIPTAHGKRYICCLFHFAVGIRPSGLKWSLDKTKGLRGSSIVFSGRAASQQDVGLMRVYTVRHVSLLQMF